MTIRWVEMPRVNIRYVDEVKEIDEIIENLSNEKNKIRLRKYIEKLRGQSDELSRIKWPDTTGT